jgi:hypothetical protein
VDLKTKLVTLQIERVKVWSGYLGLVLRILSIPVALIGAFRLLGRL